LKFQETPLVARLHQLMNEAGRGEEGDREAALAGRKAERRSKGGRRMIAAFTMSPILCGRAASGAHDSGASERH